MNDTSCYFVFDSAFNLAAYTIHYMDMEIGNPLVTEGIINKPMRIDTDVEHLELERSHYDAIAEAVNEVKAQKTILNQLMTFIYTLSSATHQKPVKETICRWIVSKANIERLKKALLANKDAPLSVKQLDRIEVILTSDVAELYRTALREGGDTEILAEKYGISAYEMNYIRAVNKAS